MSALDRIRTVDPALAALALLAASGLAGCGGKVLVDGLGDEAAGAAGSTGSSAASSSGAGGMGGGYLAVALPRSDALLVILGHALEGRTCDEPDVPGHCGHWSVSVELDWNGAKPGVVNLKKNEPKVTGRCIKYGAKGDCGLTQISGIGGLFQIDAIGAETISGVLSGLSEPGLPSGDVPFEAVRCPGEWKLP